MIREQILNKLSQQDRTMLCVGPMSKNCVDVTVDLANSYKVPIMLIASRRQVECRELGGGYVENWNTEDFVAYVRARDTGHYTILARDHGGPWQHGSEMKKDLRGAMDSACRSYRVDIENGMQLIHIDPSIDPAGQPTIDQLLDRIFELYGFCWEVAQSAGKDIAFEVGSEEQGVHLDTAEEFEHLLQRVGDTCQKLKLPLPLFVVSQTGTKVMEMRNIGSIRTASHEEQTRQVQQLLKICNRYGVLMKEHNTDYLTDSELRLHPSMGVHAANVAPEFGVVESLALIKVLEKFKLDKIRDRFLEISFNSRKWEKWMIEGSPATDRDRAIISGHYVFSTSEFHDLKNSATHILREAGVDLDGLLKAALRRSISNYLRCFRMIEPATQSQVHFHQEASL